MADAILKTCSKCSRYLALDQFNIHRRRPDGLRNQCRDCQKIENKEGYRRNIESRREKSRLKAAEWRKIPENAEKNRAAAAAWYKENSQGAKDRAKAWAASNPERKRTSDALWYAQNTDRVRLMRKSWVSDPLNALKKLDSNRRWSSRNRDFLRRRTREYREKNPDRHAAIQARRRAEKIRATPMWAIDFYIDEAYRLARLRTEVTGFPWHVDHIVPLNSKTVCGLHVHCNLAVIPGPENMKKSNLLWPDMP